MIMSRRKYSSPQIEFISMQAEGIIAGSKTLRVDNEKVIDNFGSQKRIVNIRIQT